MSFAFASRIRELWRWYTSVSAATLARGATIGLYLAIAIYVISPPGTIFGKWLPILSPPDWTSWFDVLVVYPILVSLGIASFRTHSLPSILAVGGLVTLVPALHVLESHYFFYSPSGPPISLEIYGLFALVAVLLVLCLESLPLEEVTNRRLWLNPTTLLWVAATLSVALAWTEIGFRSFAGPHALTNLVSDIGITTEAGGRDLLHGVNPYTSPLPPWGGPGSLEYGPLAFAMMVPFAALLPPGWGALVATSIFAFVTAFGVRSCVKQVRPAFANEAGLLFLALPTTAWGMEAGLVLYFMGAAFIAWALYFYISKWYLLASILTLAGFLTLVVPAALLLPFLVRSSRKTAAKLLAGFVLPLVIVLVVAIRLVGAGLVFSKALDLLGPIGRYGIFSGAGPVGGLFLGTSIVGFIVLWSISHKTLHPDGPVALPLLVAEVLLLVLLPIGYSFAALFILVTGVIPVVIFSGPASKSSFEQPSFGPGSAGVESGS